MPRGLLLTRVVVAKRRVDAAVVLALTRHGRQRTARAHRGLLLLDASRVATSREREVFRVTERRLEPRFRTRRRPCAAIEIFLVKRSGRALAPQRVDDAERLSRARFQRALLILVTWLVGAWFAREGRRTPKLVLETRKRLELFSDGARTSLSDFAQLQWRAGRVELLHLLFLLRPALLFPEDHPNVLLLLLLLLRRRLLELPLLLFLIQ